MEIVCTGCRAVLEVDDPGEAEYEARQHEWLVGEEFALCSLCVARTLRR